MLDPCLQRPRPWTRFFARWIDNAIAVTGLTLGLTFVGPDLGERGDPWRVWTAFLLWIPVEALFLSTTRATPGKWLLKVRVSNIEGHRLPYWTCFWRAFRVLLDGESLAIPGAIYWA